MRRLEQAIILATGSHDGQLDRIGQPVILHPLRVMGAVALAHPLGVEAQIVAVLHDVVEDTTVTLDDIEEQFGRTVRDGVDAVSRRTYDLELKEEDRRKESYDMFIRRCKANEIGRLVKVFDLHDNINRLHPPSMEGIKKRYYRALAELS